MPDICEDDDFLGFDETDVVKNITEAIKDVPGGEEVDGENILQWLDCDAEDQGYEQLTDEQIVNKITGGVGEDESESDEEGGGHAINNKQLCRTVLNWRVWNSCLSTLRQSLLSFSTFHLAVATCLLWTNVLSTGCQDKKYYGAGDGHQRPDTTDDLKSVSSHWMQVAQDRDKGKKMRKTYVQLWTRTV
uniref:Uncharacterized protein LOC114329233 n=1 Tax=Diabrotica virgifera virgifera TaxID=50390 RepID=A0A6P7FEC0_DIAVI